MPDESTTGRSVRLKYAAEDALSLAEDLASVELFPAAEMARAIALACMEARDVEEGRDAVASLSYSLRVP